MILYVCFWETHKNPPPTCLPFLKVLVYFSSIYIRHTLQSGYGPTMGPSEKGDPEPSEKATPLTKITVLIQIALLISSKVLISNMTPVFSKSSPRLRKSGNLSPKFKIFCFCPKFEGAHFKHINIFFFKFQPKNTWIRRFWYHVKSFFSFCIILCNFKT